MATVRLTTTSSLSGKKVILKDGKVSCSCCNPPQCCMYSADLLNVFYVADDLPVALRLRNPLELPPDNIIFLSRTEGTTNYGDTVNGVIWEDGLWARYVGGVRTVSSCLIDGDGGLTFNDDKVEDQFAACYKYEGFLMGPGYPTSCPEYPDPWDGGGAYTLTFIRQSMCLWVAEFTLPEFPEINLNCELRWGYSSLGEQWYMTFLDFWSPCAGSYRDAVAANGPSPLSLPLFGRLTEC